ncbi:MliC family protein [Methylocystis sp. JAN1]|uniref:MliC family protein n=1 Tax=Methylocystis sp. JAN1 TaxID=3397211 RepID=UPI003FA2DA7B
MIRAAAVALLLFLPGTALAGPADCAAASKPPTKLICDDPVLAALDKEASRLADLAAAGPHMTSARKSELARSQASFRKTLTICRDAKPCLQRTMVERIFHLRQVYADARSRDFEGISLGPSIAACPGLEALMSVTFVNSDPALAFLVWRDRTVVMTQAVSASGARYTGLFGPGEAQFWNKGKDATLDLPGKPTLNCEIQQGG